MSPDAEYGSPSAEPGIEQVLGMADENIDRASTEEKSPAKSADGNSQPAKSNAKDPSRPRDERPCLRCVKRGLQDQCHDGVRKKAKYLHDAPVEALIPGFPGHYHVHGAHNLPAMPGASQVAPNGLQVAQSSTYYQPDPQANCAQYGQATQPAHIMAPVLDNNNLVNEFNTHHHVNTPPQYPSASSQQVSPAHDMSNVQDNTGTMGHTGHTGAGSFDATYIDPNDPALFNFNISGLNFGNRYGAFEYTMLDQMSSNAVGTPEEGMNPMGQVDNTNIPYDGSSAFPGTYVFNQTLPTWQSVPNGDPTYGSTTNMWTSQANGADAYAIGEQSSLIGQSPHSQDLSTGYSTSPEAQYVQPEQSNQRELLRQSITQSQQQQRRQSTFPGNANQDLSRKRRRDTEEVYSSVKAPYSYTQGFHALTAFLQKRFPTKKVLRIAKALATIRPSFISCNQHLNHHDLIFMEKSFQRTLCEYEDFVNYYGTPTIICRRTGEIAAVSKEFSLVTGWRRDVLLGKEPNLNVNTGGNDSGTQTGSSSRGAATPRMRNVEMDAGRPQPVFLAELLDEDSVVTFYDDFAELAFGASRTSIIGAECSLLKYRSKEDPGWGPNDHLPDDSGRPSKIARDNKNEPLISGEAGMNALGERDGRVACSMCWTVKRDLFDIPMLIVMNFLPII
ncbi:hypothetical protein LTR08_007204 [Meristemomyces frigidus]|nr:hypothetical protein LTR08_007204 [Meristemomyces frigidus]